MAKDITGITVCYNTKDLMERTYDSIRRFHPDMPIIIIDGSDPRDPCASYVKNLASDKTKTISLGYNIGHGRGMCMGIDQAKTKYGLIFDSDIKMLKSPIKKISGMMEDDTFGVGYIAKVAYDGVRYGLKPQHKGRDYVLYLHPHFQLINICNYKKFHPYIASGAPCLKTMIDIKEKGLSEKILKDFPQLGLFVKHYHRGTRNMRKLVKHYPVETSDTRRPDKAPKTVRRGEGQMKTIAFITRVHPQRAGMLRICTKSVKLLTDNDYIHILHRDDKTKYGYGKLQANQSFTKISPINARYVMVLDDDDMLIDPDFVKVLRENTINNPEIVFFKGIIVSKGIYPRNEIWGRAPIPARIASFCYAVRLDIWSAHIHKFGKRKSGGDFDFIFSCYNDTKNHLWLNRFVAKTQKRPGGGLGEREHR